MPRSRDITVPNIMDGIEEVIIKHTKTKRGTIRTTETIVPIIKPQKKPSVQLSRSKKKETQPQHRPDGAEGSTMHNTRVHQYMEEQEEYDLPGPESVGLSICLGHDGAPCPQTVEGIRAAQVSNPGRKGRSVHGRARSTSLDSVQEGLESPESFGQLPTPCGTPQPEDQSSRRDIPDMLFDVPEIPLESTDAAASRKRTTDSGNPLFTVVDRGGIFDMEVVFCICSELDNTDEQLLQAGLFPATFKQIETLFTFSVLEDFLVDNLECKTTAQQFYAKLQNMTSKMFPNNVPNRYKQLLRASRQWRDLKNRMEHGLGHLPEWETIPDGSMAIFCLACPQPGVNLPVDWKTRYRDSPDQLIRTFIMDGNFSAEHMKHRPGEKDIALSGGNGIHGESRLLQGSSQEWTRNSPSMAIEQANSSRAHLDVTGIGATACCHGFFVPTSVVDFQKGERQINMDYSICKALTYNMEDIPVALVMYDIMCQYRVHFQERVNNSPDLSLPSSLELRVGIGLFHIHGHQDSCLPRFSPSYIPGAKQVDGEIIETLWAPLNNISRSIRGMSLDHRQEVLDAHINHSNWKKLVRIVPSLLKRWKRLQSGLDSSRKAYEALNEHFKDKADKWLKDDKAAQKDRQAFPASMDIYDTVKEKAPSRAAIQQQLMAEESGDNTIRGQTSWISCGIKIQETQLAIRYQLRSQGSRLTMEDEQILENKRTRLQKLIEMFERQADTFLLCHQPMDDIPVSSMGDYAEYDHVDDMDDSGVSGSSLTDPSGNYQRTHASNESGTECPNAEDIPLLLPSTLGWEWCLNHGVKSLALKESKLRYAQANDSIHKMRIALGFKSALFRTQVRNARTQKPKTRAWTAVDSVDTTVREHARNYCMARDAYLKVHQTSEKSLELPPLRITDLRVNTAVLGAAQVGQRNTQLPWIWSFGISHTMDGTWMDEFNRVHWLRAKAQLERWKEEQNSIHNETEWVPAYFRAKAECWKAWMDLAAKEKLPGHVAYASRQAYAWEGLSRSSIKALSPITSVSLSQF
ncbi:hypothetical protein EDB85DRAFT_2164631 [Lactarius pseudohatsudake]|nr:hypothetical protein EDB85DRAFT_2164631 [Lactarius pseudohatsudake]